MLWWGFATYRYIDYFAIDSKQRNKGLGKLILDKFIASQSKPVLLELELI